MAGTSGGQVYVSTLLKKQMGTLGPKELD